MNAAYSSVTVVATIFLDGVAQYTLAVVAEAAFGVEVLVVVAVAVVDVVSTTDSAFLFFFIADWASANDRKVLEAGIASFFTTFGSNLLLGLRDVVVTSSDFFNLLCFWWQQI